MFGNLKKNVVDSSKTATVVVTRHPALVQFLASTGIISEGVLVISHATPEDVAGKRVIGVLPMHLAVLAASVVEVPMDLPADLRGVELTLDQVRAYARPAAEYIVRDAALGRRVSAGLARAEVLVREGYDVDPGPISAAIALIGQDA